MGSTSPVRLLTSITPVGKKKLISMRQEVGKDMQDTFFVRKMTGAILAPIHLVSALFKRGDELMFICQKK